MSLLDSEFRADRLNVHNLKLNGIDISNFQIETLGDGKYIDSLRGDIQVQITPSMLDASGNYVIQQIPGFGRFIRAEYVIKYPSELFYLSPNGLDTNDGKTAQSPMLTLANVPDNSYVILLNGTYTKQIQIDSYKSVMECFYPLREGITYIGESKTGVVIKRRYDPSITSRDWPVIVTNNTKLINVTVDYFISSTFDNYQVALNRGANGVRFDNISFVLTGFYSLCYGESVKVTYNNCSFSGGTLKPNYNGSHYFTSIPTVMKYSTNVNGTTTTINGVTTDKLINLKSNTLTFNTDILNFDTITLDIWLEQ